MWQMKNVFVLEWVREIASFVRMFSKVVCFKVVKMRLQLGKGLEVSWHAYDSWLTNLVPDTDI